MDLGLTGRTFLVTAASAGLGLASARALVGEGANVVLVARRAEVLDEVARPFGDHAATLAADLLEPEIPERAVKLARERFGGIDGALVSVGGPPRASVLEATDELWTNAFAQVFLPALRVVRAVCAHQPAPRLAFVLSTSAKTPLDGMAASNGLRPGLAVLIKQLADELGPAGGRAVGLMPGTILTDRITSLHAQTPDPDAARVAASAEIPLRRLGEPDEFGRVAAFVLSDAASYVTGSLIAIDGGRLRAL